MIENNIVIASDEWHKEYDQLMTQLLVEKAKLKKFMRLMSQWN